MITPTPDWQPALARNRKDGWDFQFLFTSRKLYQLHQLHFPTHEKWEKTKKAPKKWELERSGKGSCGIQRPECQELGAAAAAAPLITLKRSETQNVDLANKVGEIIT